MAAFGGNAQQSIFLPMSKFLLPTIKIISMNEKLKTPTTSFENQLFGYKESFNDY
jgi:hypothetical protein